MRIWAALGGLLLLSGCEATSERTAEPGALPPIEAAYRTRILSWAKAYYAEPRRLGPTRISDPTPIRDTTGRLVWLVCIETDAPGGQPAAIQRQAFGFAPNYFSAPLERRGSSLVRQDCDSRLLAWRNWPELARI